MSRRLAFLMRAVPLPVRLLATVDPGDCGSQRRTFQAPRVPSAPSSGCPKSAALDTLRGMALPTIRLATDRLPPGPWIYGRQTEPAPDVENGSLVEVLDDADRFIGHALYNAQSDIRLRILARGKRSELDKPREFLLRKISAAMRLRKKVLRLPEVTDAWRVVHGEGDDLPGLVIDRIGTTFVCEHHALGFWNLREEVEWALGQLDQDAHVIHRVPKSARNHEGFDPQEGGGEPGDVELEITEHGLKYPVSATRRAGSATSATTARRSGPWRRDATSWICAATPEVSPCRPRPRAPSACGPSIWTKSCWIARPRRPS